MRSENKLSEKRAFVATFLLRCSRDGITTPDGIAVEAEKYAAVMEKRSVDILGAAGNVAGRTAGGVALGAAAGIAIPTMLGYAGGHLTGSAKNQIDTDDADSLRIAALANAYRRRAAEAKMNSQVRDFVAKDPSKYVVVG